MRLLKKGEEIPTLDDLVLGLTPVLDVFLKGDYSIPQMAESVISVFMQAAYSANMPYSTEQEAVNTIHKIVLKYRPELEQTEFEIAMEKLKQIFD